MVSCNPAAFAANNPAALQVLAFRPMHHSVWLRAAPAILQATNARSVAIRFRQDPCRLARAVTAWLHSANCSCSEPMDPDRLTAHSH